MWKVLASIILGTCKRCCSPDEPFGKGVIVKLRVGVLAAAVLLAGCQSFDTVEYYKPAGFATFKEALPYFRPHAYYAHKLSRSEWDAFYRQFPAYFKTTEEAKASGGNLYYQALFTAYAFRWTTLQRKQGWSAEERVRLAAGKIQKGDDVFKVVDALGPANRVIYNNEIEALIYWNAGEGLILRDGVLQDRKPCPACRDDTMNDYELQRILLR